MTSGPNYYYEVMLFYLKSVRATYQRLMDKIFRGMISRNVEVYVDDIAIKSDSCDQYVKYLEKVFKTLRRTSMRLNPEKCAFDVKGGKFLGFMLTHRGIEANSDKCRAITEMRSPQNIKEVQQLIGCLTTLSRFVLRLVERTRPMVQLLRKVAKFNLDKKCEDIFQQIKAFISSSSFTYWSQNK